MDYSIYPKTEDPAKRWIVSYYVGEQRKLFAVPRKLTEQAKRAYIKQHFKQIKAPGETIDDGFQLYFRMKSRCAPKTISGYRVYANRYREYLEEQGLKGLKIRQVKKRHAIDWWQHARQWDISPSTINNYLARQVGFWRFFQREGLAKKNPFEALEKLRVVKDKYQPMPDEALHLLLATCRQHSEALYTYCLTIYYTFARPTSLLRIKVSDIDLKNRIITIRSNNIKTKKVVRPYITDPLIDVIINHLNRAEMSDHPFSHGDNYDLIPGPRMVQRQDKVGRIFRALMNQVGIPNSIWMYHLKHKGIQDHLDAGVPIEQVAAQAGISVRMIEKHYYVASESKRLKLRELAPKMPDSLGVPRSLLAAPSSGSGSRQSLLTAGHAQLASSSKS